MKRVIHFTLLVIVPAILMLSCQVEDHSNVTVVKAGLLIDGTGNPPLRDVLVFIEGNRITQVTQQEEIPQGATVIDASQQVVIPGLIDTHVHPGDRESEMDDAFH